MPKYSLGRESRDQGLGQKHCYKNPGPGNYNPSGSVLLRSPTYKVGSSQRKPL